MVGASMHSEPNPTITVVDVHDVEAYERGRRDGLADRPRRPVTMTLLFVAAAAGVILMGLAAIHGSFGRGGAVADQNLAVLSSQAKPVVSDAASAANQTLREISTPENEPTTSKTPSQ